MLFTSASALTLTLISFLFPGVVGQDELLGIGLPSTPSTDTCAEVDAVLKVPNLLLPNQYITLGKIDACICISTLPIFLSTNPLAITASALAGRAKATQILTDLIKNCDNQQTCYYPPHSIPICLHGSPCSFTCKDGYTPYPAGSHPTQCVCNKPFTECNGKCGFYYACPSGHYTKRDMHRGCQQGHTACGILGRGAKSWECINTQDDLESCGGCIIPLHLGQEEGVDCTAIPGISDVSCVRGRCDVHRCMPGYEVSPTGDSCVYVEDQDPALLAAQYGLEHTPL